jgi:virulence factor Mce-like protein
MTDMRWRHIPRAALIPLLATAIVAACGSCASSDAATGKAVLSEQTDYCALLPDSVGLYSGNPVTQMGYRIGEVKAITPSATDVRVDFTVTQRRALAADVKAVIRSPSILADRSLELVGNYELGPQLPAGECIPITRAATPKSLSEVIGSATTFVDSLNPEGSTNVADVVRLADEAFRGNGKGINELLTRSSALLDSPDQAISDMGSIIANTAHLTTTLTDLRDPLKQILNDAVITTPDVASIATGIDRLASMIDPAVTMVMDIETYMGPEIQFLLDTVGVTLRKLSAHAPRIANLLNPVPAWITSAANMINNHQWQTIRYRPPLYRIRTPDGVAMCNIMNASAPGSCANVQGTPYAVDVALLQYVLTEAAKR